MPGVPRTGTCDCSRVAPTVVQTPRSHKRALIHSSLQSTPQSTQVASLLERNRSSRCHWTDRDQTPGPCDQWGWGGHFKGNWSSERFRNLSRVTQPRKAAVLASKPILRHASKAPVHQTGQGEPPPIWLKMLRTPQNPPFPGLLRSSAAAAVI